MNKSKKKGTAWETACLKAAQQRLGGTLVRRNPPQGAVDKGDLVFGSVRATTPEAIAQCKNAKTMKLAEWVDAACEQANNAKACVGVVWHHRPRKGDPLDGYVTMRADQFIELLVMAEIGRG